MLLESSALKWRISQTQFIYLERTSIFLDLDCPASGLTVQPRPTASARQLSDLGWTVQISENENLSLGK